MLVRHCHSWLACNAIASTPTSRILGHQSHEEPQSHKHPLKEPDNQYGRMAFWDESYRDALGQSDENYHAKTFSWYCDWDDVQPFFSELVQTESRIMIPGIGNDGCISGMFDYGYHHLTAFDYAPEGEHMKYYSIATNHVLAPTPSL